MASVLLGAKNDTQYTGVAFDERLLVLRTNTPGTCSDPDPEKGCTHNDNNMARAVDRAVTAGAKVINTSLGGSPMNATLRAALNRATAAGVVFVIPPGMIPTLTLPLQSTRDPMAMIAIDGIARGR